MTNYGLDKMNKFDDRSRYVKRLHSRVMRKRRFQLLLLALAVSLILVWFSITAFNTLKNFHIPKISLPQAAAPVKKKNNKAVKLTFAVIGIEQREYEQYVSGITVVAYDSKEKKINSLAFEKDVRIQIPGAGSDKIEKALFAGTDAAIAAVNNLIGLKVDKYVMVDSEDYALTKKSVKATFAKVYESNFSLDEQKKLDKKFKAVDNSDVNILEAPSRLVAVAKKPYKQLKKKEVSRLVQVLWDLPKAIQRTKVIVLNGVGTGGLAGKVAMKLIKSNYEVIDVKNASSFNYKNTLVIAYSTKKQKKAFDVQKMLGYGNIMLELDKQGLTDITVIIGRDNKENEKIKNKKQKYTN